MGNLLGKDVQKIYGVEGIVKLEWYVLGRRHQIVLLYHAPSKTIYEVVFTKDSISAHLFSKEDYRFLRLAPLLIDMKWLPPDDNIHAGTKDVRVIGFVGEDEFGSLRMCRLPNGRSMTKCDLILRLPVVLRNPKKWSMDFEELCRIVMLTDLTIGRALLKKYLRGKRSSYYLKEISPRRLKKSEFVTLCKNKINWNYILNIMTDPEVKVMVARRELPAPPPIECPPPDCIVTKTGGCRAPKPLDFFRGDLTFRGEVLRGQTNRQSYKIYKEKYDQKTKGLSSAEREKLYPCSSLKRSLATKLGGVCLYSETDSEIRIWVLCSNRMVGGKMLEHFISKKKDRLVIIDHPLEEVIPFYEKYGFVQEEGADEMILPR